MPQNRFLIRIAESVADRIGVARPTSMRDNVNLNERRFREAAHGAVRDVAAYNPPTLIREFKFYTRASTEAYRLPGDFNGFLPNTNYNRGQLNEMELVPANTWQQNKSGIASTALAQRYRVKGYGGTPFPVMGRMFIDPVPSSVEQLVFEYVSNGYFASKTGTGNNYRFTISRAVSGQPVQITLSTTSVSMAQEDVILISNHFNASLEDMEGKIYTIYSATVSASGTSRASLLGTNGKDFASGTSAVFRDVFSYLNTSISANCESCTPMMESDLVEQGMVWRMQQMLGLPYVSNKLEFEQMMERRMGGNKGASILSLSGSRTGAYNVSDGNFPQ